MMGTSYVVGSGVLAGRPDGTTELMTEHDPCESAVRIFQYARDVLRVSKEVGRSFC